MKYRIAGPTTGPGIVLLLSGLLLAAGSLPGHAGGTARAEPDLGLRQALAAALRDTAGFADRFDAEVWLVDMGHRLAHRIPDAGERLHLLRLVHAEARRADLPPELVLAVIEIESAFDPWAISVAGAQGLMQVMPFWLEELGHPEESLHRIETNLRLGCTILRHYLDIEQGDLKRALARYNGSLGRSEYPERVLGALRDRWYRR